MLEVGLSFLASIAFSDYRTRSWRDPDPKIEAALGNKRRLTLGHLLEILRLCSTRGDAGILATCLAVEASSLASLRRFAAVNAGIQDAVDLEAGNLERVVALRLEQTAPTLRWLEGWELLVAYRNRSEGHSASHRWPIEHERYFSITTDSYLSALLDLLGTEAVATLVREHPIGRLESVNYHDGAYQHVVAGEEAGVPFRTVVSMEKSIEDVFTAPEWSVSSGVQLLLSMTHSGEYVMEGPFHDLLEEGVPLAMNVPTRSPTPAPIRLHSSSTTVWRSASASAPGTCGELVQGITGDGRQFHVTCPIRKSATINLRMRPSETPTVTGSREHRKVELAALLTLEHLDLGPHEIVTEHWSDLDVGKGMGSSTADITATVRAIAKATEKEITPEQVAAIATAIESSDGSMFPGINAVEQKSGRLLQRYEWFPQFAITMVIPPLTFNTESADFTGKETHGAVFDVMLQELAAAAEVREGGAFAEAATRSAELNQRYLVNPYFMLLQPKMRNYRADGLVIGHTGTVAGLLFVLDDDAAMEAAVAASIDLQAVLPRDVRVEVSLTPASPQA